MRVSPTQGDVQMRTCHQLFWGACSLRTRKLRRSAVDPRLYNPWLLGLRRPIDSDPCIAEMLRYRNFFFRNILFMLVRIRNAPAHSLRRHSPHAWELLAGTFSWDFVHVCR